MIKKNGISFKTIQKNKKLAEFVEEKEVNEEEEKD
jgi:hypothetical protein